MRFRTQLTVGVGALLTLTLSSGILAVVTLVVTTSRSSDLTGHVVDELSRVHALRVRVEQVVSAARGYLLTGNAPSRDKLEQRERELERALESLRDHGHTSQLQAQLSIVEQRFVEYTRATARAARARQLQGDLSVVEETFERQVQPQRRALDAAVERLIAMERERVAQETRDSRRLIRQFGLLLLVAWFIGLAISVTLAALVMRRLNAQYKRVKDAEQRATEAAESRKQIVDIVAHDLLSPLNAIVLGLDVMKLKDQPVPQAAAIARAAARMQRLVNDLLDVSRAEQLGFALERKDHAATELLEATREQFRDAAQQRGVRVRIESPAELQAYVDRDRVIQVLTNLTGNAIRIARDGDEIVLAATRRDDGCIRFSVADAGPGIPAHELEHLFEAYKQGTERTRRGTLGLGLFICKSLVEAHGGTIGVDSTPGKGSKFWFDIPPSAHGYVPEEQSAASNVPAIT